MKSYTDRLESLINLYLGDTVCQLLAEPTTEEVYVNPDMRIRFISAESGRQKLSDTLDAQNVESFLRALATITNQDINDQQPALAAALMHADFGKCRVQGFLPPITPGPAFVIRKPCPHSPALSQYVADGILCDHGFEIIEQAIRQRKNIMVAGPTASGKTTLCNAILLAIVKQFPEERLIILEDTPELRLEALDCLKMQVTSTVTMRDLVRYSLRATPNRIIVGEVRDGSAKDLLDAWITGHPGGCGTVHGENVVLAMERLAELARDGAGGADQRNMVVRAVNLVILITGFGRGRIVSEIARPTGSSPSGFEFEYLLQR